MNTESCKEFEMGILPLWWIMNSESCILKCMSYFDGWLLYHTLESNLAYALKIKIFIMFSDKFCFYRNNGKYEDNYIQEQIHWSIMHMHNYKSKKKTTPQIKGLTVVECLCKLGHLHFVKYYMAFKIMAKW